MTSLLRTALITAALMFAASATAVALRPTHKIADAGPKVDLEAMIPKQFGDWRMDDTIRPVLPAPDLQAKLDHIYNQVLARTYINNSGKRIMLSIAYGGDQTGRLRVHRPESCYSGQGFLVKKVAETELDTLVGRVPIKRLSAQSGARHEPITYWIRVGGTTVTSLLGQRLAQLRFGLSGEVPDGLIFRVSSIGNNNDNEYLAHDTFVKDLMQSITREYQIALVGEIVANPSRH